MQELILLFGCDSVIGDVNFEEGHYERAEKEQSLRRIETERKLAIQYIVQLSTKLDVFSVSELIDEAITSKEDEVKRDSKYYSDDLNIKNRYFLLAIKKNRAFLEKFFSS